MTRAFRPFLLLALLSLGSFGVARAEAGDSPDAAAPTAAEEAAKADELAKPWRIPWRTSGPFSFSSTTSG